MRSDGGWWKGRVGEGGDCVRSCVALLGVVLYVETAVDRVCFFHFSLEDASMRVVR